MTVGPGSRLGRYELLATIGTGGMGEVFRAQDTRLGREVAVKVLAAELARDHDMRQRFDREARAVAALSHPNVLAIHDVGDEEGVLYAVMELLEGETLRRRLRAGALPVSATHQIALQVARGLAAAHAKNIVHRDLKPENVFLEARGTVKILDFGLARIDPTAGSIDDETRVGHQTKAGVILGTTQYMSPEQVRGLATDARTDIFSFGVVLYEMLWRAHPFAGPSIADTVSAILREEVTPHAPDGSGPAAAALERISLRCLQKRPDERFSSADVLVLALEGAEPDAITGQVPSDLAGSAVSPGERRPSIAVLPFADMSPGRELDYLCEGLADEIITALMKVPGIRVTARTSAFRFKGTSEDIRTVGQALSASVVLEGSVRSAANRLRISTQLISAEDGYQLWSERFDRTMDDVFALQDEIAREVTNALQLTLSSGASRKLVTGRTEDAEAYTLYLKGRHFWAKRTEDGLQKSVACFQAAVDRDPAFANARAGLAESYVTLGLYGVVSPHDVMPRARSEALGALETFGASPGALATLGCVQAIYEWAWPEAEQSFRQAIEAARGAPTPHHWYAINYLVPLGRFAEADRHLRQALEADPLSAPVSASVGLRSYFAHQFEQALEEFSGTLAFESSFAAAHFFLGLSLAELGRFDAALAEIEAAVRLSGGSPEMTAALGYVAGRAGMEDRAREAIGALERLAGARYVSPSLIAQVHTGLGHVEHALDWLERARDGKAADLAWLAVRPVFDALRDTPRFQAIQAGMRLPHVTFG
jgi:eukaryotic-like serine/threonine-protein kinase